MKNNYLYVLCKIYGDKYAKLRNHLSVHGIDIYEYRRRFPGAPTESIIVREHTVKAGLEHRKQYE